MPDAGRQVLNQVCYEALEIGIDGSGDVEAYLTEVGQAVEAVADDVREDLGQLHRRANTQNSLAESEGSNSLATTTTSSGFRDGSRKVCDRARAERRHQHKNTDCLTGDRSSNLTNLAEREGFEPSDPVTGRRFSRPVHSSTLPPLHHPR